MRVTSVPSGAYCHQCRRNAKVKKMRCTSLKTDGHQCSYTFCERCIESRYVSNFVHSSIFIQDVAVIFRYSDIAFEVRSPDFVCPKCTDICNCTQCTRKRGEKYVSGVLSNRFQVEKYGRAPRSPAKIKIKRLPAAPQNPTKYWGTMYGLSGERIGAAFVGEDDNADARVVVPRMTRSSDIRTSAPKRSAPKRRVFIGKVQDTWKVGGYPIRDLSSGPLVEPAEIGNNGHKASVRMYVGKKPPIVRPFTPEPLEYDDPNDSPPVSPSISRSSSLTPPTSSPDWPVPAVGEMRHFGYNTYIPGAQEDGCDEVLSPTPFILSPGKLSLAISAGLSAL